MSQSNVNFLDGICLCDALLLALAAAVALCIRSLVKGLKGGECSGCSSAKSCTAHSTKDGHCGVAQKMIADADAAIATHDSASA